MTTFEKPGPTITEETVPVWNGRLNIRVKIAGAGSPILCLHPAGGLTWDPFLSHFTQSYTVHAPEFPGTSVGDPYAIHAVDHLSDVVLVYEEIVRTLGLIRPIVVGQSVGGMLAAELASAYPNLVSKVVLLDPTGLWRENLPVANWIATAPAELPALVWAFGSTGKFAWPISDRGLRRRPHRLAAPVLVVRGREDRLAPVGYPEDWQRESSDVQVVVIDDCGHIAQVEKLQKSLAAVGGFLGGA